ncbi:hypothetical protein BM613_00005 [Sulfoacidibacillus thermotolerans]|uniref:Uncharacterized protein n=2 Tax=Sulfoacidibacillus thermotolerans TaxID=1765684 RepID=A0A2U3DCR5_SULT2|nr:hypothetical protein BM613_00005 [Sulfoacidibacillus thermotolerans]
MVIGFGFGSPLVSILMLLLTSGISYFVFRALRHSNTKDFSRQELLNYYLEQRRRAREFSAQFDLSDEEIERKIDEELRK